MFKIKGKEVKLYEYLQYGLTLIHSVPWSDGHMSPTTCSFSGGRGGILQGTRLTILHAFIYSSSAFCKVVQCNSVQWVMLPSFK